MKLRRISSLWTVFYKFGLPLIFFLGPFNFLILWRTRDIASPTIVIYLFFLVYTIWLGWGLKWVAVDATNQRFYISNYRREIAIPFSEITEVSEFILSDPRR